MEDYAAKMQLKSDADLRQYVTGYAQYRDEAVLAALAELRRRGQPASEEAHLRPLLEEAVRQQQVAAAAAVSSPQEDEAANDADETAPALYTPGVIVLFTLLFHFLYGGVLLALNFRARGRSRAIWGLAAFMLACLLGEEWLRAWLVQQYGAGLFSQLALVACNLPVLLVYLLWFWPRYVGSGASRPRNWLLPLLICFGLNTAFAAYLLHTGQLPLPTQSSAGPGLR